MKSLKEKKLIINWLKKKINYIYFDKEEKNDLSNFNEQMTEVLISSRVHIEDLSSSPCYVLEEKIDLKEKYYESYHYKHNFKNFNVNLNETIYNKIFFLDVLNKNYENDNINKRSVILSFLYNLKDEYQKKNKYINDLTAFKSVFPEVTKDNYEKFFQDINLLLQKDNLSFEEFKNSYIYNIRREIKEIKHIAIFYPFVYDHDIFSKKYYLFEINHLRFSKNRDDFFKVVENFYDKYKLNCDMSKNIMPFDSYFVSPSMQYMKKFAYLDPFKVIEKHSISFYEIRKYFLQKKENYEIFFNDLFECLNYVQYLSVKFQQENLVDALITKRSKGRQFSVREILMKKSKEIDKDKNMSTLEKNFSQSIIKILLEQPSSFVFNKNTNIEEIKCFQYADNRIKSLAKSILNDILTIINKDYSSNLKYLYEYLIDYVSGELFNNYNILQKKYKNYINKIILDLITFYSDCKKGKLSNPFNQYYERIFNIYINKDIKDLINFQFIDDFINENKKEFERYRI